MRNSLLTLGLVLVAACGPQSDHKQRVARLLRDPASAQFRNVRTTSEGYTCGEINGKNGFGAYVGFKRFMVSNQSAAFIDSDDRPINAARWMLLCEPQLIRSPAHRDSVVAIEREIDSLRRILPN